jgi:4-methylaminobutanoate oxidase (formaldehyde-forming)
VRIRDAVAGRVTSGGIGYSAGASIAYAYLPVDDAQPGTPVSIYVFGEWVDGAVAPEPLVDPTGSRIRGEASP